MNLFRKRPSRAKEILEEIKDFSDDEYMELIEGLRKIPSKAVKVTVSSWSACVDCGKLTDFSIYKECRCPWRVYKWKEKGK